MSAEIAEAAADADDQDEKLTEEQKYILGELDHLIGTDWPPSIAARLGYRSVDNLIVRLRRWGKEDAALRLERHRWDGNIDPAVMTKMLRKRGALL